MTDSDKIRAELERKDRAFYDKSEYSKKGSTLYISWPKWKRLQGRICRVKVDIHLMGPMGQYTSLRLDSAHHPIGMDRKTLDKYVRKWFVKKPYTTYWIASWNIRAA